MGIADKLKGDFSTLPPFAAAIEAGIKEELGPLQKEIEDLKQEISLLKGRLTILGG